VSCCEVLFAVQGRFFTQFLLLLVLFTCCADGDAAGGDASYSRDQAIIAKLKQWPLIFFVGKVGMMSADRVALNGSLPTDSSIRVLPSAFVRSSPSRNFARYRSFSIRLAGAQANPSLSA
jgi:hypothetical protein